MKKLPKTGDRFQVTSHHENNEGRALLQAGNRHLSRKFLAIVAGPWVPKHLVLICLVAHGFLKMLIFHANRILQELFAEKAGISLSLEKRIF